MQANQIPQLIALAFAANGNRNAIPEQSQIGVTQGAASFNDGFPPATFTPIPAGGTPPRGGDFNGIFYLITQLQRWQNAGGMFQYNAAFATDPNVGGYPEGAMLLRADMTGFWVNTVDNNTTNPDATDGSASGWVPGFNIGGATLSGLTEGTVTMAPRDAAKSRIFLAGALTSNLTVIFPNWVKDWKVTNNTTGAFAVTCKTAAGTGVTAVQGITTSIYGDGTNLNIDPATFPVTGPSSTRPPAMFIGQTHLDPNNGEIRVWQISPPIWKNSAGVAV
ncbi:hypothetical protein [Burkholderia cepacia]|uniref:hypothetical protein n=1 Tax=Burkholderia cepacia TaxID=292 RepID=UPI00264EDF5A|nr:hypothetical protein [Burkholderia cepacia]MDN7913669.1 hypothetical protein [Burkholderia cepacia]